MRIHKVLNNNAVIVLDKWGNEEIICGCGIAFKKRSGDIIPLQNDYQHYALKNKQANEKLQQLVSELPIEYLEVSQMVIDQTKEMLGATLDEVILLTLSDHLHMVVERYKNGLPVKNTLLWEIKRFYPKEFAGGIQALDIIEKKLNIRLPEDEAGFIAFHFINANSQKNKHGKDATQITQFISEIDGIVRNSFGIEFQQDDVYY